ncbi:ebs-bah-phd domain-containing protein [Purpureocillium lavendulum]|uniref:Ebs-bah-phd domain-containing protein n=1 Tax=Purpureocillium lavendulum TaxID=1247861 RepID=A0AB34G1Z9_9HYPO|nr:ebs-bah-phd domain-containing protein [Purpureocillium lavendulum]
MVLLLAASPPPPPPPPPRVVMSSKSRKRSRAAADENRADCPFAVTLLTAPPYDERDHVAKKRKRDGPDDDRKPVDLKQESPFKPKGKFKTHQTMDVLYSVEPRKRWLDMTRYNSFVLNNVKYYVEDYVYIANDTTIERQKATSKDSERQGLLQSTDYWVAKILEVRALDEHHVYARVYWMYSPDELPPNTLDGKKVVSGRQPYHGQNELIASNHMDVINVVSVAMRAAVNQWVETDDDQVQESLYWRQAFDCRTSQLSVCHLCLWKLAMDNFVLTCPTQSVELTCKCKTPANPDKTLVGCTNSGCETWLHYDCLLHDVLTRVYDELGTDKPHKSNDLPVKMETDDAPAPALRSTTPTDIKGEGTQSPAGIRQGTNGDVAAPPKQLDGITPKATESPAPGTPSAAAVEKPSRSSSVKKSRGRKSVAETKPYEGLFEAKLKLDDGPTTWQITDLRQGVTGGDRTWTEPARCLVCGVKID